MGYFMSSVELPTGASLNRTQAVVDTVGSRLLRIKGVDNVISITGMSFLAGGSGSNYGSLFVVLDPWSQRKAKDLHVDSLIAKADAEMSDIQQAEIFSINPPAIPGLGMSSGLQMQLLDINNLGADAMKQALSDVSDAAKADPAIADVTTLFEGSVPQQSVIIDRDRAELQGLTLSDIFTTLSAYMGGSYVNDFVRYGRTWQVNIKADATSRATADNILALSVKRQSDGQMVPFSSFAHIEPTMGQPSISRYNMYQSASLTATSAHGVSTSEGINAMQRIVDSTLSDNYSYAWTGEAYQETSSGTTISAVLIFAIVLTLLVLAAQYESWADPIAVIAATPTAILGTVIGCWMLNQSISIYTQIGIILLLGLAAKNAILIVEYAVDFKRSGMSDIEAAKAAGRIRLRPIMMTATAFVLGVMPMLFASGAGAESRVSLGCAVVFGMAVNALLGTLFVPNLWLLAQKLIRKKSPTS
jgi:multidrug efflux pump subunit AcrB